MVETEKPEAMKIALRFAHNEIIITFDADYLPPKDCVKRLVAPFHDPEVGVSWVGLCQQTHQTALLRGS